MKHIKYDYDDLVERATEALKDAEGWGDAYQSSTGQTLIQLLADMTDSLHYMLERRTAEAFLDTARLRNSIVARASELGYRPRRVLDNTGWVRLSLTGDYPLVQGRVLIRAGTEIGMSERRYHTLEDAYMEIGDEYVDVMVSESKLVREVVQLPEGINHINISDYSNISEVGLKVVSNGIEYTDINVYQDTTKRALTFLNREETAYDINYVHDGMRIVFGDGWFGMRPSGDIQLEYRVVDIASEPVYTTGEEFDVITEIFDDYDEDIIYEFEARNITPIVGKKEAESLEEIKQNAKTYHMVNGRGVINSDYEYWTKRANVGGIVDVRVYGEEEIDSYMYNANNVYVTYATRDAEPISYTERAQLREYLSSIKTSQAHLVIRSAQQFLVAVEASVKKYTDVPISRAHMYDIIRRFLETYFSVKEGSIGKETHKSDVIKEFYEIMYNKDGTGVKLVDFVDLDMWLCVLLDYPSPANKVFVGMDSLNFNSISVGDEWVIIVDGIVCRLTINEEHTRSPSIMFRDMRDLISLLTNMKVTIILDGAASDDFGGSIDIEIEPNIGYHLLIGHDSSNRDMEEIISPVRIGSVVAETRVSSAGFTIEHTYYNPISGFKPTIPMRDSTEITYTAPSDTVVEVWTKLDYDTGGGVFTLHKTLAESEFYNETFTERQLLKFKFLSDSRETTKSTISYSDWNQASMGLIIEHQNTRSLIDVDIETGDFQDITYLEYFSLSPIKDLDNKSVILRGGVKLVTVDNELLYRDNGMGEWVDVDGVLQLTGSINYNTGVINPPQGVNDMTVYLMYKQDKYSNITLGRMDVLKLMPFPKTIEEKGKFSDIEIV